MARTSRVVRTVGIADTARGSWIDRTSGAMPLLLSIWLIVGLFVDAWSHSKTKMETFFSPWHAIFYAGFLVTVVWTIRSLARSLTTRKEPVAAEIDILSVVGVPIFAMGGVTDMLWHSAFGIEEGVAVMMSPPHFLLFVGLVLITSGPFRKAWAAAGAHGNAPTIRAFLPAVVSLALATSVVGLASNHLWGFSNADFMAVGALEHISVEFAPSARGIHLLREISHQRGVSNILVTNLILLAPVLVMLRRWRLPFGSITMFLTLTTLLMAAVTGVPVQTMLLVSLTTGLAADWLVQTLQPSAQRVGQFRAFATVVPLVLWSLYLAAVHIQWGVAWPPTVWGGALLWTGASGLLLSLIAIPGTPPAGTSAN